MSLLKTFKTKKGHECEVRVVLLSDLLEITRYINKLSKEDTLVSFSGEIFTEEEEKLYLEQSLESIAQGNKVLLVCLSDEKIVGVCNIDRIFESRRRKLHVGKFGLSIDSDYRGEGMGFELASCAIDHAKQTMPNLRLIQLDVYESNESAKKLYKRLGFVEAGTIPGAILWRGKYIGDTVMYLKV